VELHHLRYFVAVAEELHFGRAARRLRVAQPPLSQQIRRLEEEVGARLLDRSRRHVALTAPGAAFLAHARRALAEADLAAEDARRAARGETGRLSVGFVGSAMAGPLPAILRAFRASSPDVALSLQQLTTSRQLDALRGGSLDVGCLHPPAGGDLVVQPLLAEPLVAALPADHPLAARDAVALGDLEGEPFIVPPREEGAAFHDEVLAACARAGFLPRVAQSATEMSTIVGLVSAGAGIALVPAAIRRLNRDGVAYRPLRADGGPPVVRLALAWRADRESPLLQRFVAAAREPGSG
jgi:DNA-binding transcriptional LysR family regulator